MCAYCVLKMGYTPSQFINLPLQEKAFIMAAIEFKLEQTKEGN